MASMRRGAQSALSFSDANAGSDLLNRKSGIVFGILESMESVENLMAELKALTPDQLERVAQVVQFSAESGPSEGSSASVVSNSILEQAIRNGWPPTLFKDVIGHIDEDFEGPPQLPYEVRPAL